jgi:hypothetical protein
MKEGRLAVVALAALAAADSGAWANLVLCECCVFVRGGNDGDDGVRAMWRRSRRTQRPR